VVSDHHSDVREERLSKASLQRVEAANDLDAFGGRFILGPLTLLVRDYIGRRSRIVTKRSNTNPRHDVTGIRPRAITNNSKKRLWREVFSRSTVGSEYFAIRGNPSCYAEQPIRDEVFAVCRRIAVACAECTFIWYTSWDGFDDRKDFLFLDGGVKNKTGNYFCDRKGAWVYGIKALRLLCYELGLTQPRRKSSEVRIPTHEELLKELATQVDTDTEAFVEQLRREGYSDEYIEVSVAPNQEEVLHRDK
jgi:hypothetical protein